MANMAGSIKEPPYLRAGFSEYCYLQPGMVLFKTPDSLSDEMVAPANPKDPGAEAAETEFVTVSRAAQKATWMALRPITGRTHQLRAHMLAIGHPILGDPKYHDAASLELSDDLKLQLHARRIVLPHPGGGDLVLEAPISPELRAGFERFGFEESEAAEDPFARR